MRSYHLSGKARRRGQALLLAVLIMIFAALLSAAFIGIVAANLNQTARQSDKNRSVEAANAGLKYVNDQLTASADGDRWRSEMESIPPAPGDPSYSFYYTPMEIAQGWARTTAHPTADLNGNGKFYNGINLNTIDPGDERIALDTTRSTGKLELVKLPDPRTQPNAPNTFLSQVVRVSNTSVTTPSLAGSLKVTVIGVSPDDPTAFHRIDAYKGGFKESPIAQVMRVVSNYDFRNGQALVAQANPAVNDGTNTTTRLLAVTNAKGDFSKIAVPFAITLSDPAKGQAATVAVVTDVSGTLPDFTFTLAKPIPSSPTTGIPTASTRVELAADFGAPNGIHVDNVSTNPVTPFTVPISLSDAPATATSNQVDGARINNSLIWSGTMAMAKLRPLTSSFGGTGYVPGTIWASGVVAPDPNGTSNATIKDISTSSGTDSLKASDDTGIFSTAVQSNQYDLVNDGWGFLKHVPAASGASRNVQSFTPPVIDSGVGLERYRNLSRFSPPALSSDPVTASLYGNGQGIYISNFEDKEKLWDSTLNGGTGGRREMYQKELFKMWLSATGITDNYSRNGTADLVTNASSSLEAQHLRGWVAPDEFRARGVEVELGNDSNFDVTSTDPLLNNPNGAVVTITLDSRDDGLTNAIGPVTSKTWKDSAGADRPGVYRRRFAWPQNGVIFAEGNIRIKGSALGVPRSLTVVSMNNIYIEDSLKADTHKVLLMAKRNVVLNPTRVIGRADEQTILANSANIPALVAPATTTPVALQVDDASAFKVGDIVDTLIAATSTVTSVVKVNSVDTTVNPNVINGTCISGAGAAPVVIAANSSVTSHRDKFQLAAAPTLPYSSINAGGAIARRVSGSTGLIAPRFVFNHGAAHSATDVLNIATKVDNPPVTSTKPLLGIIFSLKKVMSSAATPAFVPGAYTVPDTNKLVRVDLPSGGPDSVAASGDLTATKTALEAIAHSGPVLDNWHYDVTVNPDFANLPTFYLAGIGNRYDYGSTAVFPTLPLTAPDDWHTKIANSDIAPNTLKVPLATSINLALNGVSPIITNEQWNGSAYDTTLQFGFSPSFQDVSAATPTLPEDILTADQSFYQADANKSTLDSRSLGAIPLGTNTFSLMQTPDLAQPTGTGTFPDYRLLGMKIEDVAMVASSSSIATINPGHTFDINAFVYAQSGSWFVIPTPAFEPRLHATLSATGVPTQSYFDSNNNGTVDAGEFLDANNNGIWDVNEYADLNRNGIIEDGEKYAFVRYARYNYAINFTGAIAENQTPLVNSVADTANPNGPALAEGAVADWMDKTTTSTMSSTVNSGAVTIGRIQYNFDPAVVNGSLEDNPSTPTDETDYGFRLPQTANLFNVS